MTNLLLEPSFDFGTHRRVVREGPGGLPETVHQPLSGSRGTVYLVPGWSGPRSGPADLLVFLADRIAAAGWTAVRSDLPGRGDSAGDFAACDLDKMIESIAAQNGAGQRVLLGLCSGGNVSLGAATLGTFSGGLIALSTLPFQPSRGKEFEQKRAMKNLKNYAKKALSPSTWMRLFKGEINTDRIKKNLTASEGKAPGERNLKDSKRDIEKELLQWKGPALFIWGDGDEEAALARQHFEKLHQAGMGARAETRFHTIAGANHNFYGRGWREELSWMIVEFLNRSNANL